MANTTMTNNTNFMNNGQYAAMVNFFQKILHEHLLKEKTKKKEEKHHH